MFSDVGPLEVMTLGILSVLLFGPDRLPEIIQQVGRFLRRARALSESATQEIRSELGPEFENFDFADLHPKAFVHKHVLDGDSVALHEIRSALDPTRELTQVTDAVREVADEAAPESVTPRRVSLTKDTKNAPSVRHLDR